MRYQLDDLRVDTAQKLVFRAGERVNVSGLSFDFLAFLLTRGNRVVSFKALISGVWSPAVVNEDTVTQRALLLRKALGDDVRKPRYFRSVRGQGYQLVASPRILKSSLLHTPAKPRAILAASALMLLAFIALWRVGLENLPLGHLPSSAPDMANSHVNKLLQRARYYSKIGQKDDNDRAIELYKSVLQNEPGNIEAKIGLSRCYSANMCRYNAGSQQAQKAENLAMDVIREVPKNFQAHSALGYSYDCRGQVQAAKDAYRRAIELDANGDVKSQSSLAYLQGETGQLAEALALNLSVRRADPEQTFNLIQLARVYELLGLHPLAEALFAESFELYPDNIFSNLSFPRHLFHQGKFASARDILTQAKSRPAHPDLFLLSAELAAIENNLTFAREELATARKMRPTASGYALLEKAHLSGQEALNWATEKLTAMENQPRPHHPEGWIYRAMLHQAAGNDKKGIDALLMAVESGYRNRGYLMSSPFFSGLRTAKGFAQVLQHITLAVDKELDTLYAKGLIPLDALAHRSLNPDQY